MDEVTIATLVDEPTRRVRVSLCRDADGGSRLRLRDETLSDHVGWFVQASIDLTTEQVAQMRSVLGTVSTPRPARSKVCGQRISLGNEPDCPETLPLAVYRAG